MNLIGGENKNLPSSSLSYEEFAVDADETFEQAVKEVEETPSFNFRKRKGEKLRRSPQENGNVSYRPLMLESFGIATATGLGLAEVSLPTNPADAGIALGILMVSGWCAGRALTSATVMAERRLGSSLEDRAGSTQVRSEQIKEIKSELSDPNQRPNDLYAADLDGYSELHGREGIEEMMDSLTEHYPEAQWAVAREEENPFQVIGMTLEEQPETGYDEEEYDQRKRLAEETVEYLGSGSVEDILSTDSGVAPTSPRYEDTEFDVVIVDRNPEQSYDPEDNFFDYSDNLSSQPEPAEKNEQLQEEPEVLEN